jgi:hypothetical protein
MVKTLRFVTEADTVWDVGKCSMCVLDGRLILRYPHYDCESYVLSTCWSCFQHGWPMPSWLPSTPSNGSIFEQWFRWKHLIHNVLRASHG